jgi:hypothetical protein
MEIRMRNSKNGRRIPSLVRQFGEPLFKSVFDVWGTNSHGNLNLDLGHATLTYYGDDFKDCKRKLEEQTDGVFFKPKEIVDLNPEYSRAFEAIQQAHKEFAKKFAAPVEGAVA